MNSARIFLTILTLGLLLTFLACGQPPQEEKGKTASPAETYAKIYDPHKVETLRGEVVSVDKVVIKPGMPERVRLTLRTPIETLPVYLGPTWFIDTAEPKIHPKDQVDVKGLRITLEDKPAFIGAEVKKGDQVLKLRHENGVPVWAGQKRP
jgi:hypothetical protein